MSLFMRRLPMLLVVLAAAVAAVQLSSAALIYGKAWLAPILIERVYAHTEPGTRSDPPWPWADFRPVARLYAERLGQERLVLEGDSGNTLAFGPGMARGTLPGQPGLVMISAHRDTHFRFLRELLSGDLLSLEYGGSRHRYRVLDTVIADARDGHLSGPLPARGLLLVTCYPFDAIVPGGPLRYVVVAEEIAD